MLRRKLHRFVPANIEDPFALAVRLLRTRDPAALFSMEAAMLGLVCAPLDLILEPLERKLLEQAEPPTMPLILVCGPPRAGTTLVSQVLIGNLPVAYLTNLTTLFPRAPLTAEQLFRRFVPRRKIAYRSYYGRTRHWSGPNDSLQLWDRWLGSDRTQVRTSLGPTERAALVGFFGALQQRTGLPVVNKNNGLNSCAHIVADALPTARFICLHRDPAYLAQSLLRARREIQGGMTRPYGLAPDTGAGDPIEDVCRQVRFHERLGREQARRLGAERFRIVSYEAFCSNPREFVTQVSRDILGEARPASFDPGLIPFEAANRVHGDGAVFQQIQRTLDRLSPDSIVREAAG